VEIVSSLNPETPLKGSRKNNFGYCAPRWAADLGWAIEENRRCSPSYIENFQIETEPKAPCRWDAKSGRHSWASPERFEGEQEQGFTLLESIIAIALIGTAIIISTALLNTLAISSDHLRIHMGLLHEVETTIEMMRAGLVPLESGVISTSGGDSMAKDLVVTAIVEPRDIHGLYDVTIRAECHFRSRRISRTLVTAIWRP
jgi:prepilin-type N-terminal cleavage/methylation domain-containing protein